MAGGCLVDDFDGDGLLDVFMPTTDPVRGALLLRNRGDGTFEDVSTKAGLADQVLSLNACHADFDNDGALDIVMLRGAGRFRGGCRSLRNRGGVFDDVTLSAGLGEPIAIAGGWLGRLRQRRPRRPVRCRRVRPSTPRPTQPEPALPQPRRRHL